ncbi:MAG TPA: hypothetical protein VFJ18_05630, partial [Pararhizobium sp.]|nr:hypothetical protein [Pararhizobium sp.]
MPDLREEILARLVAIAAEVPGVVSAGRNRVALSESARPAIIVLDADEVVEEEERASRPGHAPQLVVMTPELFVLAGRPAAEIGAKLNAFRGRIIRRVLTDAALVGLTGPNGFIRYAGCATALAAGRSMEGEMS